MPADTPLSPGLYPVVFPPVGPERAGYAREAIKAEFAKATEKGWSDMFGLLARRLA
jgi:hypothetical protein